MLTAYSRVTVVTAERKVDLALPTSLPVADVVPQVLRYCAPPEGSGKPPAWTLARIGGQPLAFNQTLSDAGVLDGDVIELRPQHDEVRPAMVEDVRDAVEDSADAAGGAWTSDTTIAATLLTASLLFLALAAVQYLRPDLLGTNTAGRLASAVAAIAVLLGMSAWARYFSTSWVAQVAIATAMIWGYLAGGSVGVLAELDAPVRLMIAMALTALVAGGGRAITVAGTGHAAVAAVLLAAAVAVGVVELSDVRVDQVYRVAPAIGLLVTGVIPRLSLSVGGLASADYRVRHIGRMGLHALRSRYRQSNAILVGSLGGIALVIVWGSVHLTFGANQWDRYLALGIGLGALLRSRVYSRTHHMVPLRAAGVVVLALQLVRLGIDVEPLGAWMTVILAGVAVAAVGVGTLPMSVITRARVKRILNIIEFLVVVEVVVMVFGATGVIAKLGGLV